MTIDAPIDARPMAVPINSLLTAPILPTLLKLAIPNTIAMFGSTLVAVAETSYIGRLGTEPLAGIALVFPFIMLTRRRAGAARRHDRRRRRTVLYIDDAWLRPRILFLAGRPRRRARTVHTIFAVAVLRRDLDLAGEYAGLGAARACRRQP